MGKDEIVFVAETSLERFLLVSNASLLEDIEDLKDNLKISEEVEDKLRGDVRRAELNYATLHEENEKLKSAFKTLLKGKTSVFAGTVCIYNSELNKEVLEALKVVDDLFDTKLCDEAIEDMAATIELQRKKEESSD